MTETKNTQETKVRTTTTGDRCDRCNAEAFVVANGINGSLYFCGHHFNKHEAKVREYAFEIIDDREFINVKPSMAAN